MNKELLVILTVPNLCIERWTGFQNESDSKCDRWKSLCDYTQSLKKLKKEVRDTCLSTAQFRKIGSNRFIDINDLDEDDPEVFNSIYYKVPYDGKNLSETPDRDLFSRI